MKTVKKVVSLLLTLSLCLGVFPANVSAGNYENYYTSDMVQTVKAELLEKLNFMYMQNTLVANK